MRSEHAVERPAAPCEKVLEDSVGHHLRKTSSNCPQESTAREINIMGPCFSDPTVHLTFLFTSFLTKITPG